MNIIFVKKLYTCLKQVHVLKREKRKTEMTYFDNVTTQRYLCLNIMDCKARFAGIFVFTLLQSSVSGLLTCPFDGHHQSQRGQWSMDVQCKKASMKKGIYEKGTHYLKSYFGSSIEAVSRHFLLSNLTKPYNPQIFDLGTFKNTRSGVRTTADYCKIASLNFKLARICCF